MNVSRRKVKQDLLKALWRRMAWSSQSTNACVGRIHLEGDRDKTAEDIAAGSED